MDSVKKGLQDLVKAKKKAETPAPDKKNTKQAVIQSPRPQIKP